MPAPAPRRTRCRRLSCSSFPPRRGVGWQTGHEVDIDLAKGRRRRGVVGIRGGGGGGGGGAGTTTVVVVVDADRRLDDVARSSSSWAAAHDVQHLVPPPIVAVDSIVGGGMRTNVPSFVVDVHRGRRRLCKSVVDIVPRTVSSAHRGTTHPGARRRAMVYCRFFVCDRDRWDAIHILRIPT